MPCDDAISLKLSDSDIAIVGMAAHLPGATDLASYWANLRAGIESIRTRTPAELLAAGESAARMVKANFVPAAAILDDFAHFDADFFGLSPKEAAIMALRHRQFLEVAWGALETAAHLPEPFGDGIGVWAGCGMGVTSISTSAPTPVLWPSRACSCCVIPAMTRISCPPASATSLT